MHLVRSVHPVGVLLVALAGHAIAGASVAPRPLDPNDVKQRLATAGDAEKHKSDVVIVFDHTDVRVRANGIGSARRHVVTKILKEAGVRGQSPQRFGFDPHTNRLDLIAVRVHRADGTTEAVDLDRAVQQPQPASAIFWGTQQYVVALPRLEVGDAVETISELTGFNVAYLGDDDLAQRNARGEVLQPPVEGHWHDEVNWWSGVPIIDKRYTVRVGRDRPLQFEIYNGELSTSVLFDGDDKVYSFQKKNITPFASEPAMEPAPNVAPKLLLASMATWEEKSRWLYDVSEPTFEADEAIRAKTMELIAGKTTDEEKWNALCRWVADNIRYAGTSRGMCEGYTNHDIIETFHDRAGVCKDKAGMLVGMLRIAGYDSFLVMTMARQRVDRVPADQFNHAVTCVRKPDGTLVLLDPTWMPFSRDIWSTLEPDQHVVYGLPEGKGLLTSPSFPPEANQIEYTGRSTLAADGTLEGRVSIVTNGSPETRLRRSIAPVVPDERRASLVSGVQRIAANAALIDASYVDPSDYAQAMSLNADYRVEQFPVSGPTRRFVRLPLMQLPFGDRMLADALDKTGPTERKYGLRLAATRLVSVRETVTLPSGWKIATLPEKVSIDGPAASLMFECTQDGSTLTYTCTLKLKEWTVPPEHYANFKKVMDKFTELGGRVVVCETEAGHAN